MQGQLWFDCLVGRSTEEWYRLLHVVIVGGGPTGVEFAGELCDFVNQDLARMYPKRAKSIRLDYTVQCRILINWELHKHTLLKFLYFLPMIFLQ